MSNLNMQKHTARNLVLSPNSQVAQGGVLADAKLTYRASVDPSTAFMDDDARYNDQGAAGHGTDFATVDVRTALRTMGTLKGMGGTEAWMLGYMLALAFGQETVVATGALYTHTFTIPNVSARMPCTTVYVEDTADVHRKFNDMAAKSLSIDVPERGPIQGTLEMVGTGNYVPGTLGVALPAVATPTFLLGSDFLATVTPVAGAANPFSGRQTQLSIKLDRQSKPFEASGDGLAAGSVQAGVPKFSVDLTIAAASTDDINGYFEGMTQMSLSLATNAALAMQLGFNFPLVRVKTRKLGNKDNTVIWQVSFDEGSCLQNGNTPAISAYIINNCPAYLVPA